MKYLTPQDNKIQLIQVCAVEFARSALRFSFDSKWMSASFFLFTAFIGFLAIVIGFNKTGMDLKDFKLARSGIKKKEKNFK